MISIRRGDCIEEMANIGNDTVDLVVTDPPYFLDGLDSDWKKGDKRGDGVVGGLPVGMKFDPNQGVSLQRFITEVGLELIRVMKPGAFAAVFSQPRLSHRMAIGLEDAGFEIRDVYAWRFTRQAQPKAFSMDHFVEKMDKSDADKQAIRESMMGRKTPQLRPEFETIIIGMKPRNGTFIENWQEHQTGLIDADTSIDGKKPSTVMTVEKPTKHYNDHLTVKPVALIEHLIQIFSIEDQLVLDPFLGSGTTAVASYNTGRRCVGIEINADYIDIAHERITGSKNQLRWRF